MRRGSDQIGFSGRCAENRSNELQCEAESAHDGMSPSRGNGFNAWEAVVIAGRALPGNRKVGRVRNRRYGVPSGHHQRQPEEHAKAESDETDACRIPAKYLV